MIDAAARELVRQRAGHRCEYCRLPQQFSELRFHVEHIIARKHEGADEQDNLALACPECNLFKGPNLSGVEPVTHKIVRLFHPRQDEWSDHFGYDGAVIAGRTSIARTTVSVLKMNEPHRVRVRELLLNLGIWEA